MSTKIEIPIKNIYYMLYYAWNKLDEAEIVDVENIDTKEIIDLFAKVLIGGMTHILKRGFDRGYIEIIESTQKLSGKIDFSASVKRNLIRKTRLVCIHDIFSYNVLHNKILKTTIENVLKVKELDEEISDELVGIYRYLGEVDTIELRENVFSKVKLHRNNFFYDFLLKVCYLIYENILIDEESGERKFRDFLRDEKRMSAVFEEFIRRFYQKEQSEFDFVGREYITWDAEVINGDEGLLPKMETDITLESDNRKIIIDAKYYKEALQKSYDKEKIRSANLYQIFAYLKNVEKKGGVSENCEGILLYPTVNNKLNESANIQGHKVSIRTIDLNQDHREIHKDLLEIIQ